ncbi:MAG TPA: hypothetical protein VF681_01460 [Abditibacteriaceae bacterium]
MRFLSFLLVLIFLSFAGCSSQKKGPYTIESRLVRESNPRGKHYKYASLEVRIPQDAGTEQIKEWVREIRDADRRDHPEEILPVSILFLNDATTGTNSGDMLAQYTNYEESKDWFWVRGSGVIPFE